jgi:hypothetical protein
MPAIHLSESEFIDLIDGTLAAPRRAHLDVCEICSGEAAQLTGSIAEARHIDVPEPPPFFWTQFSARVSAAVERDTARPASMRWHAAPARALALATAAAIVAALAVLPQVWPAVLPHIRSSIPTAAPVGIGSAATAAEVAPADAVDLDADDAWALVRTLAADLDDDEMRDEGVSAGEDAVEHLTSQLTDAERTELARLLQEQLSLGVHAESAS